LLGGDRTELGKNGKKVKSRDCGLAKVEKVQEGKKETGIHSSRQTGRLEQKNIKIFIGPYGYVDHMRARVADHTVSMNISGIPTRNRSKKR